MGLSLPVEVAFLVLILPIAFAYLLSVAGLVVIAARAVLRSLASWLRHRRGSR